MRLFNKDVMFKCHSEGRSPEESRKAWWNEEILRFAQNDRRKSKAGFSRTLTINSQGFTLLELLISITLLGLIVLITVGAMRLGFRSVDSGEKKIESLERIKSSLNIIESQIQSEIPLTYDDEGSRKYYFKGEREFMQFPTNYSIWGGQKGYVIVTYRVESRDQGKQVLYASENIVGIEEKRDAKLFDAFDKIYFEYFFKDPTEEQGKWIDQWTDDTTIPEKVRLHIIDKTKDISMIIPFRTRGSLTQTPLVPTRFQPSPGGE